jgi:hypothetical protein
MALTNYTSCHAAFYHFIEARSLALEADTSVLERDKSQHGIGE